MNFIKEYWDRQGEEHGASHVASWADRNMIDIEIDVIAQHLPRDAKKVLDVGCGNGHSSFAQLERHELASLTGLDYSENLIAHAERRRAEHPQGARARFQVGDIRELPFDDGDFDFVYTTRTLINLPNWTEQAQGIDECLRVTRSGGTVVFSEAFWEALCRLNALRQIAGLPPLVEHDFNRYLKTERLEQHLETRRVSFEVDDFSSVYYLGSRFLRELILETDRVQDFSNPFNDSFRDLERECSISGFGIQKAFVVRKP